MNNLIPLNDLNNQSLNQREQPKNPKTIVWPEPPVEDVVDDVLNCTTSGNQQRKDEILMCSIDYLLQQKTASNGKKYHFISLSYLAKNNILVFNSKPVINKLLSVLSVQPNSMLHNQKLTSICLLAVFILQKLFADSTEWPISLIPAFFHNYTNERTWVEHPTARQFVCNILTGFCDPEDLQNPAESISKTQAIANSFLRIQNPQQPTNSTPTTATTNTSNPFSSTASAQIATTATINAPIPANPSSSSTTNVPPVVVIQPRFWNEAQLSEISNLTLTKLSNFAKSSNLTDVKAGLSLMPFCFRMKKVRQFFAERLTEWLNQVGTSRNVKDVLPKLAPFFSGVGDIEIDTFYKLLDVQIHNSTLSSSLQLTITLIDFISAIVQQNPQYAVLGFRKCLQTEFNLNAQIQSAPAGQQHMIGYPSFHLKLMSVCFSHIPGDKRETEIGSTFQNFLKESPQRPSGWPALRPTIIRTVRTLIDKLNMHTLCVSLLAERKDTNQMSYDAKERWVNQSIDLVVTICCTFAFHYARIEKNLNMQQNQKHDSKSEALKHLEQQEIEFRSLFAAIQGELVVWCWRVVPKYLTQRFPFLTLLKHVLFLKSVTAYYQNQEWNTLQFAENIDFSTTFAKWISESLVHESTIKTLVDISLGHEPPIDINQEIDDFSNPSNRIVELPQLPPDECLELILNLLQRSRMTQLSLMSRGVETNHLNLVTCDIIYPLFSLCICVPPISGITHNVCFRKRIWTAVLCVIILCGSFPSSFGAFCWENLTTIKLIMEKLMKQQAMHLFSSQDEISASDEKQYIREFVFESFSACESSQITLDWLQLFNSNAPIPVDLENQSSAQQNPNLNGHVVVSPIPLIKKERETQPIQQFQQAQITPELIERSFQIYMVNDINSRTRIPPPEILHKILSFDQQFKISSSLRRCREPDFLRQIIEKEGTYSSLTWFHDIIAADPDALSALRIETICEMFYASLSNFQLKKLLSLLKGILKNVLMNDANGSIYVFRFLLYQLSTQQPALLSVKESMKNLFCTSDKENEVPEPQNDQTNSIVSDPAFKWLEKLQFVKGWQSPNNPSSLENGVEVMKKFLWTFFCLVLQFETSPNFLLSVVEFVYQSRRFPVLRVSTTIGNFFCERPEFHKKMTSTPSFGIIMHKLSQKLFVETFQNLIYIQQQILNEFNVYNQDPQQIPNLQILKDLPPTSWVHLQIPALPSQQNEQLNTQNQIFLFPLIYISGFLQLISFLPQNQEILGSIFTQKTIELIGYFFSTTNPAFMILNAQNDEKKPLFNSAIARNFIKTNQTDLVNKGIEFICHDKDRIIDCVEIITEFGMKQEVILKIVESAQNSFGKNQFFTNINSLRTENVKLYQKLLLLKQRFDDEHIPFEIFEETQKTEDRLLTDSEIGERNTEKLEDDVVMEEPLENSFNDEKSLDIYMERVASDPKILKHFNPIVLKSFENTFSKAFGQNHKSEKEKHEFNEKLSSNFQFFINFLKKMMKSSKISQETFQIFTNSKVFAQLLQNSNKKFILLNEKPKKYEFSSFADNKTQNIHDLQSFCDPILRFGNYEVSKLFKKFFSSQIKISNSKIDQQIMNFINENDKKSQLAFSSRISLFGLLWDTISQHFTTNFSSSSSSSLTTAALGIQTLLDSSSSSQLQTLLFFFLHKNTLNSATRQILPFSRNSVENCNPKQILKVLETIMEELLFFNKENQIQIGIVEKFWGFNTIFEPKFIFQLVIRQWEQFFKNFKISETKFFEILFSFEKTENSSLNFAKEREICSESSKFLIRRIELIANHEERQQIMEFFITFLQNHSPSSKLSQNFLIYLYSEFPELFISVISNQNENLSQNLPKFFNFDKKSSKSQGCKFIPPEIKRTGLDSHLESLFDALSNSSNALASQFDQYFDNFFNNDVLITSDLLQQQKNAGILQFSAITTLRRLARTHPGILLKFLVSTSSNFLISLPETLVSMLQQEKSAEKIDENEEETEIPDGSEGMVEFQYIFIESGQINNYYNFILLLEAFDPEIICPLFFMSSKFSKCGTLVEEFEEKQVIVFENWLTTILEKYFLIFEQIPKVPEPLFPILRHLLKFLTNLYVYSSSKSSNSVLKQEIDKHLKIGHAKFFQNLKKQNKRIRNKIFRYNFDFLQIFDELLQPKFNFSDYNKISNKNLQILNSIFEEETKILTNFHFFSEFASRDEQIFVNSLTMSENVPIYSQQNQEIEILKQDGQKSSFLKEILSISIENPKKLIPILNKIMILLKKKGKLKRLGLEILFRIIFSSPELYYSIIPQILSSNLHPHKAILNSLSSIQQENDEDENENTHFKEFFFFCDPKMQKLILEKCSKQTQTTTKKSSQSRPAGAPSSPASPGPANPVLAPTANNPNQQFGSWTLTDEIARIIGTRYKL